MKNSNFLKNLLLESGSYGNIDSISALAQHGNLKNFPIQPVYFALKNSTNDEVAEYLEKLSEEQRTYLLDIDLWVKDELDPSSFERWLDIYDKADEDLRNEFLSSEQFALYFKGILTISTFDVEDPLYPEHENFFLTPDSQLLIEFDENFSSETEIKRLIDHLYGELGVEKAYSQLFKIVSDNFTSMIEDEYRVKKLRLLDVGIIDYHEALHMLNPFHSIEKIDQFIKNKAKVTGGIDIISRNQALHRQAIIGFDSGFEDIINSLNGVSDQKRKDFLQFSFVRMMNATISLGNMLKGNSLVLGQNAKKVKFYINLGFNYVSEQRAGNDVVFESFDFVDLYKIGVSLTRVTQTRLKKSLELNGFNSDSSQAFLGSKFSQLLENSFLDEIYFESTSLFPENEKLISQKDKKYLSSASDYRSWMELIDQLIGFLPFARAFYESIESLKREEKLQDAFYLNYKVTDIDQEAILLSSLINFENGNFDRGNPKMGVSLEELKAFVERYFNDDNEAKIIIENNTIESSKIQNVINSFSEKFGFTTVKGITNYLLIILDDHLGGYNYKELTEDEFSHVGGPVILGIKGH